MRVLVTGSSGLIGREVTSLLAARGHEAIRYDIAEDGADIRDPGRLSRSLEQCDGVLHLAAISRVAWGEEAPDLCHSVNVAGTETLIQAMLAQAACPWLVFASSREVYGDPDRVPVVETAPRRPVNHYGRSKATGEERIEAARGQGLRSSIVRLSNVYGTEHDHPDRAVPSLLWRSYSGQELRLSGVNAFFDFVHVDDTARGLVAAAELLSRSTGDLPTVHLSTGVATTLGDLARRTLEVTGSASEMIVLPARSFDVKGFCGDPARAAQVLGWRAQIALDEGLRRYLAVLRSRGRPLDPVTMPLAAPASA